MSTFSNKHDHKRTKMVIKIDSIVNDISLSRNIEQSIYNYIIKLSKEKNIQRTWNNTIFAKLYNSKIISIFSNLKKDSYIHNGSFLQRIKNGDIDRAALKQIIDEKELENTRINNLAAREIDEWFIGLDNTVIYLV